jgi:hypothetical protein
MYASVVETAIHDCRTSREDLVARSVRKAERTARRDDEGLKKEPDHSKVIMDDGEVKQFAVDDLVVVFHRASESFEVV